VSERPSDEGGIGSEGSPASYAEAVARAAPGLARIYASMWWRTAEFTVGSTLRAGSRLLRGAASGQSPADLIQIAEEEVREYARELLGREDSSRPERRADRRRDAERPARFDLGDDAGTADELRRRGAELLRLSADVRYQEDVHPAYARILEALAPDEARILRLLALGGAQPSVDVRAGLPMVSELVAPGRSMIAAEAGCRHPERVRAYLNNLYRLGLIWFSREPVRDRLLYQVLEAQPEVVEAMRKGGRTARTVRRSIVLTPFGKDFCDTCLPLETDEVEAVPEASVEAAGAAATEAQAQAPDEPLTEPSQPAQSP
jgi:Abortive infection alpha